MQVLVPEAGLGKQQQQVQDLPRPGRAFGQGAREIEASLEMRYRLEVGKARERVFAGLYPIGDCLLRQRRCGIVLRNQLGVSLRPFRQIGLPVSVQSRRGYRRRRLSSSD